MKIESLRIENFRGFKDETIIFENYSCFVGPNGSGKSTVLAALNVFFRQYKDSKTDLSKLTVDDFHHKNFELPIKITVTFGELSHQAKTDLSDYVRQDKLIVTSVAKYDAAPERAEVKQYGNRLGINDFRKYFETDKSGGNAGELKDIYGALREIYNDLPAVKTKGDMLDALREFEATNPEKCILIPSEDQFYGISRGSNRLSPHIQWVFVSAVKDITEESEETKNSSLGQLLARSIRSRVNFTEKIGRLRDGICKEYQDILDAEQPVLDDLSISLELKLRDWAHPNATAKILWKQDPDKSIKIEEPWACIRIGERGFEGELARFGHGMQRSYMLTLLQELASVEDKNAPTLIMGIEEPELYQHPPQARHLADVLHDLSLRGSQILLCSHSPLFIPADDFDAVRVVRETGNPCKSSVAYVKYKELAKTLNDAGHKHIKESGIIAKLYPSLNPVVNEMFFCKVLILTEGIEDLAYITSYIGLSGKLNDFRRYGCHIVPVGGKSELIRPIAIAKQLNIPVAVIFDADTDKVKEDEIIKHKKDNSTILKLMGYGDDINWPVENLWKEDMVLWKTNITDNIKVELGSDWGKHLDLAFAYYGNPGGLKKNPLAISRALESAWNDNVRSTSLARVSETIIEFANKSVGN